MELGKDKLNQAFIRANQRLGEETGVSIHQAVFEQFYAHLVVSLLKEQEHQGTCLTVGIQGSQGVGKSTLTVFLKLVLSELGYQAEGCSIDDFYTTLEDRQRLAQQHYGNPFYQVSRGMPGTHYHEQLAKVLRSTKEQQPFIVPVFDKSIHNGRGDVSDKEMHVVQPLDFFIIEGWCVCLPQVEESVFLETMQRNDHINELFEKIDPNHQYFHQVFEYNNHYQQAWRLLDHHCLMLGEDIQWVEQWRAEQEQGLIEAKGGGMSKEEVSEFVKPYLPFTWLYYYLANTGVLQPDSLLRIGFDHLPHSIEFRG